jgi:DNA excision repair protein ERCC-4
VERFDIVDEQGADEKDEEFLVKMILKPLRAAADDDPNVAHRAANLPRKRYVRPSKGVDKDTVTLTQMVKRKATSDKTEDSDNENDEEVVIESDGSEESSDSDADLAGITGNRKKNTNLFLSAYEGGAKQKVSLVKLLFETRPKYVILYDIQLWFVRQLEAFKAMHASMSMRVYVLMYMNSSEEQRFLTSIRTEKESFEILIRQKAVGY